MEIGVRFSVGSFVSANPSDLGCVGVVSQKSNILTKSVLLLESFYSLVTEKDDAHVEGFECC